MECLIHSLYLNEWTLVLKLSIQVYVHMHTYYIHVYKIYAQSLFIYFHFGSNLYIINIVCNNGLSPFQLISVREDQHKKIIPPEPQRRKKQHFYDLKN